MNNHPSKRVLTLLAICQSIAFHKPANSQTGIPPIHDTNDRVLVVSGGGARGAWGVGVVDGILSQSSIRYTAVFGTSTGSLMAPMILLREIERLKKAYLGVSQRNIFNKNPFKFPKSNDGTVKVSIRPVYAVRRLISGKKSLGETYPLLHRIKTNFQREDFDRIRRDSLNLSVLVTNMGTGMAELKSSDSFGYDDMCEWIWASANEPVWMTMMKKNGNYYVDGGVRNVIPVRQAVRWALKRNYQRLDVIVNNSEDFLEMFPPEDAKKFNWLKTLIRTLQVYNYGTVHNDRAVSMLMKDLHNLELKCASEGAGSGVEGVPLNIRVYFMPQDLAKTYQAELAFFPEPMRKLMEAGRASIQSRGLKPKEFNITNSPAIQEMLKTPQQ